MAPKPTSKCTICIFFKTQCTYQLYTFCCKTCSAGDTQLCSNMLKKKCPSFAITVAHFDFEIAAHTAFRKVFPSMLLGDATFTSPNFGIKRWHTLGFQDTYLKATLGTAIWVKTCFGHVCQPTKSSSQHSLKRRRQITKQYKTSLSTWTITYIKPSEMWTGCLDGFSHILRTAVRIFIDILKLTAWFPIQVSMTGWPISIWHTEDKWSAARVAISQTKSRLL